jgi:DNA-binding response OmpR family regulator
MDEVWGYDSVTTTRTVDVHVAWLRQKLGEKSQPRHLITVRGRGYRFDAG